MQLWSKLTFETAQQRDELVGQIREYVSRGAPDGIGVFKAREGYALYFSPIATSSIRPFSTLPFEDCARPNEMAVQVVVGPYDEPAWYDQAAESITAELDVRQLDEMGLIGPDTDIDEVRRQTFG